jgi:AraC-like DNA-binding protein
MRRFVEFAPAKLPWIEAVWHHEAAHRSPASQDAHSIPPDGSIDLIVRIREGEIADAFVHGASLRAHTAIVDSADSMVGIRFRPGIGASLLRVRASELTGGRVSIDELTGRKLEGRATIESATERLLRLAVELHDRAAAPAPVVLEAVQAIERSSGAIRIAALARSRRVAERTLHRKFLDAVGLGPKELARVVRARAAKERIRRGGSLAAIAVELGFSDQAHLTRELVDLLGERPSRVRV